MKKDIANLARFLLNDYDGCQFSGGILKINKGNIFVNIKSEANNPEYLKLTVVEFNEPDYNDAYIKENYFNEIASQVIHTTQAHELISDIWKEIEKYRNKEFIEKYGNETYSYYRDCYISALKGVKGNDLFEFNVTYSYDKIEINLKEKNDTSGNSYFTEIRTDDYRYGSLIHGALHIGGFFPIRESSSQEPNYENINIYIPIIDVEKEINLGEHFEINTKIKYSDDNIFDYIHTKLRNKESSSILNMFELQNDLSPNNNHNKKMKL